MEYIKREEMELPKEKKVEEVPKTRGPDAPLFMKK